MRSKATIVILFLAFAWVNALYAQTNPYRFTQINVNQGLSHNQIKSVFKDHAGFVWIGTISGLNRYDGYTVKVFTNVPGDSTSIISNDVNKIFEGPGKKMWIHTWSGTNVYDPLTETFDRNANKILHRLSIPAGQITDIKKDSKGTYWFIHDTAGLFRYSEVTGKTTALSHQENDSLSIATNQVSAWVEDKQGNIWIVHRSGVLEKIDPLTLRVVYRTGALNHYFQSENLEYNLMADADGDLWCFSINNNSGLFYFNSEK
jgi:ligand-binding sensor domain-containing protein